MIKITIDTNCIIDLEDGRPSAPYIRTLYSLYEKGRIMLRVVAIGASEKKPDGSAAKSFGEFEGRLGRDGLNGIEILLPMGYIDISFIGWGIIYDDEMIDFERRIHEVLFPEIDFDINDFYRRKGVESGDVKTRWKWQNAKCDVQMMWSHIHNGGDIFVTTDGNFHKITKKPQLISLGAGDILRPKDVVAKLEKLKLH